MKKIIKNDRGLQVYFEPDWEGTCPCFEGKIKIDDKIIKVWGRCWRVSDNEQDLHIYGKDIKFNEEIGKWIKKALDKQEWYSPYTLIIHKTR